MSSAEPAIPLVLAGAALLAGGDDVGWLLVGAAALVLAIRRWEAIASGLPGGAGVAAGLAAQGPRWHLVVAALALVTGVAVVLRRQVPTEPMDPARAAGAVLAVVLVIGAGWLPMLHLSALAAYREGAVLAAAGGALAVVGAGSTAALRARSGKMEDPAPTGGADSGA